MIRYLIVHKAKNNIYKEVKSMSKGLILIVEDDNYISNMIKELLIQNRYEVNTAYSGTEALLCIEKNAYDLILLDLMLPGMSGEEVLKNIRRELAVPVIGISAKDDKDTRLGLLKDGADDYITKPFDNDELLVRMEVLLRRHLKNNRDDVILTYKDIQLDNYKIEVRVSGQVVVLTKREFLILQLLMSNPNKVFTKNNIFESVWNEEFEGEDNSVNVHISNIRSKLAKYNANEKYIKTVWGIGFKME